MNPGQIVEFIEDEQIITGVCVEERRGRLKVLTEFEHEVNLAATRFVHISQKTLSLTQSRDALAAALKECSDLRNDLARQVNIPELWEILVEEDKKYEPGEIAELVFSGKTTDDHISAIIRAILADRVYFRFRLDGFRPNQAETVEQIRIQRARDEEKRELTEHGGQWLKSILEGQTVPLPQKHKEIIELLKDYAVSGKDGQHAQQTEAILRSAGITHAQAAFDLLVRLNVWSPDENLLLYRLGIRRDFVPQVLDAARTIQEQTRFLVHMEPRREDFRSLETLTIDSEETMDVDDALTLEILPHGYRAGIHITDVSCVVAPGSVLDEEASFRCTSVYLPDERIPMLPKPISEDLCSLKEGEVRPCVSLLLDVCPEGQVLSYRFALSWIQVNRRLTYADADKAISDSAHPLAILFGIAKTWRKERINQGALIIPLPEITVRVNDAGQITIEKRNRETSSQILVSEMMIQTNSLAAEYLSKLSVPCIYRCQAEPRQRIIEGPTRDIFLNYRQRRSLSRAELQVTPSCHTSLGISRYTTVTSPIRRYPDLVVQRQLAALLSDNQPVYTMQRLEKLIAETTEILKQANYLEIRRQRYWILRYLKDKRGEKIPAIVVGRFGNRIQILLPEYMLETTIPFQLVKGLCEGDEIEVQILGARPMDDELRVEPC